MYRVGGPNGDRLEIDREGDDWDWGFVQVGPLAGELRPRDWKTARRIAAALNFCEGIETETLEAVGERRARGGKDG